VGGAFHQAGPQAALHIARWALTTKSWNSLGKDMNDEVYALTVYKSWLNVGGAFTSAIGYGTTNHVAGYSPKDQDWWGIGTEDNGVDGPIYTLQFMASYLCMGGTFDQWFTPGHPLAKNIACADINPPHASLNLGGGLNSNVYKLLVVGNDLYATGHFTKANPGPHEVNANYIARWNKITKTWYALGSGLGSDGTAMTAKGKDVYVGGIFQTAGGKPSLNIARWMGP
jgi:hypothetical protein